MHKTDIVVIGGGPAGLNAAIEGAKGGAQVVVLERDKFWGGQLIKQTHKFFGSQAQYASYRGSEIADLLYEQAKAMPNITMWFGATALAYYPDNVVAANYEDRFRLLKANRYIVATGAAEKTLLFPNNDLPGIYGAGAVQTLAHVHGILPGKRVLMVGSGNIGLIVSYQLLQAGVQVVGLVEGAAQIGGYLVHAGKIRRQGVPIYTSHTIKEALGDQEVEGAVIWQLKDNWEPIPGTEKTLEVDVICIAVGLSPLAELLWQAGCEMKYIPQLGGHVPIRDNSMRTTKEQIYVAGDVAGVEEASAAMVEGQLAGLEAAQSLGFVRDDYHERREQIMTELTQLRSGPVGERIRQGLQLLVG